ncbi:MAG: hypothetical protein CL946_07660 [Ectothiorhodospiraceae bacterium]|nr:hypothetical protein [Ectothiorhodospiraceae bacterium]
MLHCIKHSAFLPVLSAISLGLLLLGCSSTEETTEEKKPITEYEEKFDPSKYRDEETVKKDIEPEEIPATSREKPIEEYMTIERVEKVMGFRIQIYSTASLEDAEKQLDRYTEKLGDSVNIHMVFDAPYYKLRVGDYLARDSASTQLAQLKELGLEEAWIVRDRVDKKTMHRVKMKQ